MLTSYGYINRQQMEDYFWEGVSEEFVDWFYEFQEYDGPLDTINSVSERGNVYLVVPSLFILTFHVVVLTRKSMRTSSTNIFLVAIAITDLAYILSEVWRVATINVGSDEYSFLRTVQSCSLQPSYFMIVFNWSAELARNYFIRCSSLVGLLLTVVRCLAIRSQTPTISNRLISARFGVQAVLAVFLICLPMPFIETTTRKLIVFAYAETGIRCPVHTWSPVYTFNRPTYVKKDLYPTIVALIDGAIFELIPSILTIIFTLLLVVELQKARRRGLSLGSESVQTTKINILVVLMAIQFLIIRIFLAFSFFVQAQRYWIEAFAKIIQLLPSIVTFVLAINFFLHVLICVMLSSEYRNTIRNMFVMETGRRGLVRISNVVSIT